MSTSVLTKKSLASATLDELTAARAQESAKADELRSLLEQGRAWMKTVPNPPPHFMRSGSWFSDNFIHELELLQEQEISQHEWIHCIDIEILRRYE